MNMASDHLPDPNRARAALQAIPPDLPREEWVRAGMAAHAAGLGFDDFDTWSSTAPTYDQRAARATWRSFKAGKGVGVGTLFTMAAANGWHGDAKPATRPATAPRKPIPGMSPAEVYARCQPATNTHGYLEAKRAAEVPLDRLRVVPAGDLLHILGEPMAGWLAVPVMRTDGTLSSLQFIAPPEVVERLKAKGRPGKLNLPRFPLQGWFTVGDIVPGGVVYVCEGIGQAWACWQATGVGAVVCFSWARVRTVAAELRQRDASARLVLVPDVGKEDDAQAIAIDLGAAVAAMPAGWAKNSDVSDLALRDGRDELQRLLEGAVEPTPAPPRYKLLGSAELAALPALSWRIRNVLPAVGLAGLLGPTGSAKTFLGFDAGVHVAEGQRWFGHHVEAAPVVYVALEGEAGFRLRAQAWEAHYGRKLPGNLHMVLQPFKLTEPQDVADLAAAVPTGAVVFIDTMNRAAPTADENSSRDMGLILEAAKRLQLLIGGLVVLVHHTGKDATKGARGHSSLFAAMDAAIEVTRDGNCREWRVAKSKDGADGEVHAFRLKVETLAIDEHGDPVTSCVVVSDRAKEEVQKVRLPRGGNQKLVLDALRPLFKDGETGKPGAPPLRPCIELEVAIANASGRLTCETHRRATRAREAITGLISSGVMGGNEGWLWLTQ